MRRLRTKGPGERNSEPEEEAAEEANAPNVCRVRRALCPSHVLLLEPRSDHTAQGDERSHLIKEEILPGEVKH